MIIGVCQSTSSQTQATCALAVKMRGRATMSECHKCHYEVEHPWHDDGTPNWRDMWMWEGRVVDHDSATDRQR